MSTLVAYIAIFIGAGILDIADGVPLNPAADPVAEHGRRHPDRDRARLRPADRRPDGPPAAPVGAPVLSRGRLDPPVRPGLVMTVGALVAYQIGDAQDGAVVGSTMLLTTLSLFHVVAGLLARDQRNTIFDRAAIPGATQLRRYGRRAAGDPRGHHDRPAAAHLRHHRADLHPVVDLHRTRGEPRGRGGGDQGHPAVAEQPGRRTRTSTRPHPHLMLPSAAWGSPVIRSVASLQ